MAGKSVRAFSSHSVDIQVDEMRDLPAPGRSERPPLGDGYFSGELLCVAYVSLSKSPPFQTSEGKVQCLCRCPELSVSRNIACLLCPHLLLTLCTWITSRTTISPFESPVRHSSAKVGVASMVLQSFQPSASQCASQVSILVELSVAFVPSLLWMSMLEGAFSPLFVPFRVALDPVWFPSPREGIVFSGEAPPTRPQRSRAAYDPVPRAPGEVPSTHDPVSQAPGEVSSTCPLFENLRNKLMAFGQLPLPFPRGSVDDQVRRVDHFSAVSTVPDEAVLIRPSRLHRASYFTRGARLAMRVYVIIQHRHDGSVGLSYDIVGDTQKDRIFCIVGATARIHPPHTKDEDTGCGKRSRKD